MKRTNFAFASLALALFGSSVAHAAVIGGATTLPGASVTGQLSLHYMQYSAVLNAPGSASVGPSEIIFGGAPFAGCAQITGSLDAVCALGSGTIKATLGSDPRISLQATPANGAVGNAGASSLSLVYNVEDIKSGAAPGATSKVKITALDGLSVTGAGSAEATLQVYSGSSMIYNACDLAGNLYGPCAGGASAFANLNTNIVDNQVYTVVMQIQANASGPINAFIDPMFTPLTTDGGQLIYSPGVFSATPEPAPWGVMLVGMGLTGWAIRRRQRSGATAAA